MESLAVERKICTKCKSEKDITYFYKRKDRKSGIASQCKKCVSKQMSNYVSNFRRKLKENLVHMCGNVCKDCGNTFPPFVFDFDHIFPEIKSFNLSTNKLNNKLTALVEVRKCDLVCSNCHRIRTHKQRCKGCLYCETVLESTANGEANGLENRGSFLG